MAKSSQTPRKASLSLLSAVMGDGQMLQEVAGDVLAPLSGPDRARAQRLALEVMRKMARADACLKPYLKRQPPLFVLNVLRLATCEMLSADEAPHGVVNDSVSLVRARQKTAGMAGMVNAVLRRIAQEGAPLWQEAAPGKLPKWLRGRLLATYGEARVLAMEAAHEAGAPLDLTLREGHVEGLAGTALATGSLRCEAGVQVSELPGFEQGKWWVQDAAAAMPVRLLAPQPGERILDLCAAPGGKTMQLAAAGAEVTALDSAPERMERLQENLARTGLAAQTVVADAKTWRPEAPFDAVLLDAPCSATGTIRRHPDLPYVKDGRGLRDLFTVQSAFLDHALTLLRPGGRLMFCTCSLLPQEGEAQIIALLKRQPGLTLMRPEADWIEDSWRSDEGGLRLTPEFWARQGGMDGFYMALIRKP